MEARHVSAANGWQWLVSAFALFKRNPLMWLVLIVIYVVIAMIMSIIPVIGSLAFNLMAPVFLAGLMLGCQALEAGHDLEINHLFAGFKQNSSQLISVGGIYLVGIILIVGFVFITAMLFGVTISELKGLEKAPETIDPATAFAILLATLLGMLLAIPLIMAYWFAPILVAFHDMPAIEAFKLSFQACLKNIGTFFVYSIIAMVLILAGMIPFGLGLLVVIPVMILSLYTSYKDIFNISAKPEQMIES